MLGLEANHQEPLVTSWIVVAIVTLVAGCVIVALLYTG